MSMAIKYLSESEVVHALELLDLTTQKDHAIGLMVEEIKNALETKFNVSAEIVRHARIVAVEDNYGRLYYPEDTITKSSRYTRWINDTALLRTHMTAVVPSKLKDLTKDDSLLLCPGIVFRRDVVDKTHVGEPHQMDVWRITENKKYKRADLLSLVSVIVEAILPGVEWRFNETSHFYTKDGIEVEVLVNGVWLEILECGLVLPRLLDDSGLNSNEWSGLALGLGLDRAVMLRKGITDIRILRSENPKIAKQMSNLDPYVPVSFQPQIKRDLSIAVINETDNESIGDRIRSVMGDSAKIIEEVSIISETAYEALPEHVRQRLGMSDGMKNILLRIIICPLDKSMTSGEANDIYNMLYAYLHQGSVGYTIENLTNK